MPQLFQKSFWIRPILTEHAFDVGKDGGVMNQTAEAIDTRDQSVTEAQLSGIPASTNADEPASLPQRSVLSADRQGDEIELANQLEPTESSLSDPSSGSSAMEPAASESKTTETATAESTAMESTDSAGFSTKDVEGAKKARAPRMSKASSKPVEAGGSITTIVERVVRMTTLNDEHSAALARLFNVSLPEDYVARLTRLTGASLGPIGSSAAEALTIVLGLESANPIHVGVQLGRLAATSLPDVYRCAHALTGETAVALPKGDNAVFAVADVLATLTAEDFVLARALSSALE
jgi:hypothetical protein